MNKLFPFCLAAITSVFTAKADLWVSESGVDSNPGTEGAPFRSIQAAVDAAPAEGTTIHVSAGTYYVKSGTTPKNVVEITKPVRIIGASAATTIIDAQNTSGRRCVKMNAEGAEISGFTLRKGSTAAWDNANNGAGMTAGIWLLAGTANNLIIEQCNGYHSPGANVSGGVLSNSVIRNMTTGTNPQGLAVRISGTGLVTDCEICNCVNANAMSSSGIIYITGGELRNSYVHDNLYGFAGHTGNGSPTSCSVGGVYQTGGKVTGCRIENNGTIGYAAGAYISGGTMADTFISGNCSTNIYTANVGAVYISGGTLTNCTVTGNRALAGCEGLWQNGGKVIDCRVYGNGCDDFRSDKGTYENVTTNCSAFTVSPRYIRGDSGSATFTVTNPDGAAYTWEFSDGGSATGTEVSHQFQPGRHSATLYKGGVKVATMPHAVMVSPAKIVLSDGVGLQAAIDLEPAEIELGAGTYDVSKCPAILVKPIKVRGTAGRNQVILDAKSASYSRCAVVKCAGALLEGVKLTRANTSDSWSQGGGAVVSAGIVSNCWFTGNNSYRGGAFHLSGTGVIADSLIESTSCGGGNTRAACGEMTGGLFVGNTVQGNGNIASSTLLGSVYIEGSSSVVSNCVFRNINIGGVSKTMKGGAIYLVNGLVVNCVITNNKASVSGGGVHMTGGTLRGCLIAGNSLNASAGSNGGGVYNDGGTIENCTVVGNTASVQGGGIRQLSGTTVNSIAYYNNGGDNLSASGGTVTYSGAVPLVAGTGNTAAEPAFMDKANGDYRFTSLATDYIDHGAVLPWMAGAVDLAGNARINGEAPEIGAIEYYPSADEPFIANFSTENLSAKETLTSIFTASISKYDVADCTFVWNFGDGSEESEISGSATATHTYSRPGAFNVTLTVIPPQGAQDNPVVIARDGYVTVIPRVCYVSPEGSNTYPYESWATAATNPESAIPVGSDEIVVTNGTYTFEGISLNRALKVVSVNGPEVTVFKSKTQGRNLVIVDYVDAWLEGFTMRDASIIDWQESTGGAGLRITAGIATNCIVRNCQKYDFANTYVGGTGKLFDSQLINNSCGANSSRGSALAVTGSGYVSGCIVTNNTSMQFLGPDDSNGAGGAGLFLKGNGIVTNCLFANNRVERDNGTSGGVTMLGGLLTHSIISNNYAKYYYGGVYQLGGTLRNCLIAGNYSVGTAAGCGVGGLMLKGGTAESLTIVGNSCVTDGGGVRQTGGMLRNSIVYGNTSTLECQLTGGEREFNLLSTDPQFEEGSYRLSALSTAKDAGTNQTWMADAVDLDGLDRIQNEIVDIGCYEADASVAIPFSAAFLITSSEKLANGTTRITFTASSVGEKGAVTWFWKFGDIEDEEWHELTADVTHVYQPGAYTVSLKAYDTVAGEYAEDVVKTDYAVAVPDICYVGQGEGVVPHYPYATPSEAAASLKDALTAGSSEIVIAAGVYTANEFTGIGRPVVIRGETGNPEDVVLEVPRIDGQRVLLISSADVVVSSVTLRGGSMLGNTNEGGSVLKMSDGVVTNCVLSSGENYYHGAVVISGGLIVDSVIRNNNAGHSVQDASAVTMYGGLLDRCVITNNVGINVNDPSPNAYGSAVTLNGVGTKIRNCLIAGNRGGQAAGVRVITGAELVNCTIVSNRATASSAGVRIGDSPNLQDCYNNIVWGNVAPTTPNIDNISVFRYSCAPELTTGTGNTVAVPEFRDPDNGDWRLKKTSDSPCVDKGFLFSWMKNAKDLRGDNRVRNGKVDIGAYEYQSYGLSLIVR